VEELGLIAAHEGRLRGIEQDVAKVRERVTALEERMSPVERGVANFREFQRKTMSHQAYMKGAAATVVFMFGCMLWTVDHAIDKLLPAAKVLLQYYDETHPTAHLPKVAGRDVQSSQNSATDPSIQSAPPAP